MIDHNKFQNVIKNAFNRVSTFKNTPWYNETNVKSKEKAEIEDINVQQSPQIPIWEENSSNFSNVDYSSSFPLSDSFSSLHTISDSTYIDSGTKSPGIYLDVSGSVALFVRMKLVALNDPDICSNSISYTAYPTDTSDNLLLENAYNFNYNSQLNITEEIEVFKPYNYTLEYYDTTNDTSFVTLEHSDNWIFDNDTGIIVFEDNPTDIDLDELYFTFVKYIGVQGLENLLYYKDGKIGIGNKDPQFELDISGSVYITGDLVIGDKLTINDDVVFIDNSYVGINTNNPQYELDVSGSVIIEGDLSINSGIGPGFFPIGAIIMWPTNIFPDGYGEWLLCDGSTDISSTDYPDLSNILGSSSGYITIPDFQDNYVKMSDSNATSFSISGENVSSFKLEEKHVPDHSHKSNHTHDISDNGHAHQTNAHSHDISDNGHVHQTNAHSHDISDNGHNHTITDHAHDIIDDGHTHEIATHGHNINTNVHIHNIVKYNANVADSGNTAGGGNVGGVGYTNVEAYYDSGDDSDSTVGDEDTEYNAVASTQNSASVSYDISLASNISQITSTKTLSFTIDNEVLDSSATTFANSSIQVGDSSDNDTSNVSSNLTVGDISGNTDISSNILGGGTNNDLKLDISGLEYTTAFFFIRAK